MAIEKTNKKEKTTTVDGMGKLFCRRLVDAISRAGDADEPTLLASIMRGKTSIIVNPERVKEFRNKIKKSSF